jgi:hypothetical protein
MTIREFSTRQIESLIASGGQQGIMAAQEQQRRLLSGDATWQALQHAVHELSATAPKDHDVVLRVADLSVLDARYIEPHSFLFRGISDDGHESWIVMHFSQVVFRVIHRVRQIADKPRVITGFAPPEHRTNQMQ